jgi:hypothetical protein
LGICMKRLILSGLLVVVLGAAAGAGVLYWIWGTPFKTPGPPAPDAPEADIWRPEPKPKLKPKPKSSHSVLPPEKTNADYGWPPDFKLPLDIHLDPPEIPERLQKPSGKK